MLCTGNAARSVMAGAALEERDPRHEVGTAGTLAVDGMPMSWRTRQALHAVGVPVPKHHRSKQVTLDHLDRAELVIAMAPEHVEWVRRNHRSAAPRTATLRRLVDVLPADQTSLAERVGQLRLQELHLAGWEEVVDPGGGEAHVFTECAQEIVGLVDRLVPLL
jgi:protein-tyrosine-phosphatase